MVQEFHVLRCFSCQTFQVQQVKKSKKWTCKVCGEKQSLIKEFGQGSAADCRRHVQKLNALRGQMLEVNSEELLSQREPDENEDVLESLDQNPKSEEVDQVSRWSKYTDQTAEGPNGHENEEEEENIYTERQRFRSQGTRKRKKISPSKSLENNCEDEESWTGCSGFKRQPYLHDRRFNSSWSKGSASTYSSCGRSGDMEPCTSTNLPSSRQAVCYPTACSSSTYTAENSGENKQQCDSSYKPPAVEVTKGLLLQSNSPSVSSRQKFGESKIGNKDSKWDKFLTVVPDQQDEEEYDYEGHNSSNYSDNTVVACFTEALIDMAVDSEECRYPLDGKTDSGALGRQKSVGDICVDGNLSSPNISHSSKPASFENAVCKQPTLFKMPCSSLSINSLFFTDEDFDDTF
ncbi:MRN complex-interacting protein isoform X2 [Onychostoma macrolepis]|uniref:MRN complex-interacting protein isoform X2 n=1 Tax=Onychostoma macrolepis TaxID=369639 RepID=UPI00272D41BF|nr:MRN complex-interacting protein isoform X2 [Onychostoma macrolepis]